MSCIGVYQRNVITYNQTTWMMLFLCLWASMGALLVFLIELNCQSWSRHTVFWLWNSKGLITDVGHFILPVVMYVTPQEEILISSPVEFYTRKLVVLEPRRPATNLRAPIMVREAKQNEQMKPRPAPAEFDELMAIPPSTSRHTTSLYSLSPCIKHRSKNAHDITILDSDQWSNSSLTFCD
jgi:hypothetical protein